MRKRMWWLGPLAGPVDRWLSGSMPSDPLYLSNQSQGQKAKRAALLALPLLAVGALVAVALSNRVPVQTRPEAEPTSAEVAAKLLPDLAKDIKIAKQEVQVVDAVIRPGPPVTVSGTAHNNTDRKVLEAELIFDLTDAAGSALGAVNTTVRNLAPRGSVSFQFPVKQKDAAFVLVRETRVQ